MLGELLFVCVERRSLNGDFDFAGLDRVADVDLAGEVREATRLARRDFGSDELDLAIGRTDSRRGTLQGPWLCARGRLRLGFGRRFNLRGRDLSAGILAAGGE